MSHIIDEVFDLQVQQVGNAQRAVHADDKQQQIPKSSLTFEQIFDMRDVLFGANRFNEIHKKRGTFQQTHYTNWDTMSTERWVFRLPNRVRMRSVHLFRSHQTQDGLCLISTIPNSSLSTFAIFAI